MSRHFLYIRIIQSHKEVNPFSTIFPPGITLKRISLEGNFQKIKFPKKEIPHKKISRKEFPQKKSTGNGFKNLISGALGDEQEVGEGAPNLLRSLAGGKPP
jgi:hypothetical protein